MIGINRTDEFMKWLKRPKDATARVHILVKIQHLSLVESFGDAKLVSDGVCKMRINYGPDYQLYYTLRGNELVLLLIGGDKFSQQSDAAKAKKLHQEYE